MKETFAVFVSLVLGFLAGPALAQTGDRWVASEDEASANLPAARGSDAVMSATLSCAAQRWTLRLELSPETAPSEGAGLLDVDGKRFELAFAVDGGAVATVVPRDALEPMQAGVRMAIDTSGALEQVLGDPVFALRGSRVAIDAVANRCTLRDMGSYAAVTFTPFSSYLTLVRELRRNDIDDFVVSTTAQPTLDAAMVEFGGERRVLFTRMCGSSWYFGTSGCNVNGYAPDAAEPGWRLVFDSENVHLHTDPRSDVDGWPDLATLPVGSQGMARLWRWNGAS